MQKINDINGREFSIFESHSLTCTKNGHNKFWRGKLGKQDNAKTPEDIKKPWVVLLEWGRIGTVGSKEEKRFLREHAALTYIHGRLKDKLKKGYEYEPGSPVISGKVSRIPTVVENVKAVKYVDTEWDLL